MENQPLPKRRGIVLRATPYGMVLADSYGKQYVRVNGGLRKVKQHNAADCAKMMLGIYP
jgi:hypothetical protein